MRIAGLTIAALLVVTLAGCATPGYRPYSTWSLGGYSERALAPDRYQVRFAGGSGVTPSAAEDFAALRAAEICLSNSRRFVRVDTFTTAAALVGSDARPKGVLQYQPVSDLTVTCAAGPGTNTQDAVELAAMLRARHGI